MPKNNSAFADVTIAPLTGRFDVRSASGTMPVGDFRIVMNASMNELGKRCRRPQYRKYGVNSPQGFNNQDLHDQLNVLQYSYSYGYDLPDDCRQAITHLASVGSDETFRTLIAATKNAIFASNDYTGNWRVIANGLGGDRGSADDEDREDDCTCNARRFRSTQLGNYVLFTNNYDPVLSWGFGDPPFPPTLQSAEPVVDLYALGITKARCITEFGGFVFIGNVTQEGIPKSSRIFWSDYNAPISWIPGEQSLASYHDFGAGERVLRMEPLGRYLMVYTDKSIYQGVLVNDTDLVFQFNEIPVENPLRFEHALVTTGKAHIYAAENGIYAITSSDPRPIRVEWMHRADGVIYTGIPADILCDFDGLEPFGPVNQLACDQFIGGYNTDTQEVWFSWPTDDNLCANMSLVLNIRYESADLVDHGFTAFTNYRPDYRPLIRDWLNSEGVCPSSVSDFVQEGLPILNPPGDPPLYIWNADENPELPIDPDSWCARLHDTTLDDLCDGCDSESLFLMADAFDFTIKESNEDTFFRERYDPGLDIYAQDGYTTILQSDLHNFGLNEEKLIKQILVDYDSPDQSPIGLLFCDVAFAAQPRCPVWVSIGDKELRCLTYWTAAQHAANNTRPSVFARYNTLRRGRYLGYRLYIRDINGACCFSEAALTISKVQARTH